MGLFLMAIPFVSADSDTEEALVEEVIFSVVHIYMGDPTWGWSWGGGVFIDDEYVLTSYESISARDNIYDNIYICTFDVEENISDCWIGAEFVIYDADFNLALLKVVYDIGDEKPDYSDPDKTDWRELEEGELDVVPIEFSGQTFEVGDSVYLPYLESAYEWSGSTLTYFESTVRAKTALTEEVDWFWTVYESGMTPGYYDAAVLDDEGKMMGLFYSADKDNIAEYYSHIVPVDTIILYLDLLASEGFLDESFSIDGVDGSDYFDGFDIFDDVDLETNNAAGIAHLKSEGIIEGYSDGTFGPENTINRAEFLKIMVEGAGYAPDESYADCFPDVGFDWYAKYVCFAAEQGWVGGYPDGTFLPGYEINKVEAMKVLLEVFEVPLEDTPSGAIYLDFEHDQWWSDYVYTAKWQGIIDPDEFPQYYYPDEFMTRSEISDNLFRLLNYYDYD